MKCYYVDSFTDTVFKGNPAAVCVMESWPSDEMMQNIACENNLSETAFAVRNGDAYDLRWFSPRREVDLCGHATLAAASVLLRFEVPHWSVISFNTRIGNVTVQKKQELYVMDLPAFKLESVEITGDIVDALGVVPTEVLKGRDLVCVLNSENLVRSTEPDLNKLALLDGQLVHLTSRGNVYDCVTRSFGPKIGIAEDPVCGSGHCHVIPYWSRKLNRQDLCALQASQRSGVLYCRYQSENGKYRVLIGGKTVLYAIAELYLPGISKLK